MTAWLPGPLISAHRSAPLQQQVSPVTLLQTLSPLRSLYRFPHQNCEGNRCHLKTASTLRGVLQDPSPHPSAKPAWDPSGGPQELFSRQQPPGPALGWTRRSRMRVERGLVGSARFRSFREHGGAVAQVREQRARTGALRSPGLRWRLPTKSRPTSCCRTCAVGSWAGAKVRAPGGRSRARRAARRWRGIGRVPGRRCCCSSGSRGVPTARRSPGLARSRPMPPPGGASESRAGAAQHKGALTTVPCRLFHVGGLSAMRDCSGTAALRRARTL